MLRKIDPSHFTIGWVIHITGPACGFEKRAALKTLAKGSKGHHKVEGGKEEGGRGGVLLKEMDHVPGKRIAITTGHKLPDIPGDDCVLGTHLHIYACYTENTTCLKSKSSLSEIMAHQ